MMTKQRARRAITASTVGRYMENSSIVSATSVSNVTVVDPEPPLEVW